MECEKTKGLLYFFKEARRKKTSFSTGLFRKVHSTKYDAMTTSAITKCLLLYHE